MPIIEKEIQPDDIPVKIGVDPPQTESDPVPEPNTQDSPRVESNSVPEPNIQDSPQTDPDLNASGEIKPQSGSEAPSEAAGKPPKRITPPEPDIKVLAIDDQLGLQTEVEKARDKLLDLVESLKTGRYLTDTIQGVERSSKGGEPRAILYHGDFKVMIIASMVVQLPRDLRGQNPNDVYYYLLTKRLGSEIDYVVKGIDANTGIAVGSRMEAMATKRRHYYLGMTREGTYRIYEGLCCEARVMSVIPQGVFVELFGIDVYIPLREISYVRLADAMGLFTPGNRVLVKIVQINREDPDNIRVMASIKQVSANPMEKAMEKVEVGNNYVGTVSMMDSSGIFVHLDLGADCRCKFPNRARPPKGARVIVKVVGMDRERKLIWGAITYITTPK